MNLHPSRSARRLGALTAAVALTAALAACTSGGTPASDEPIHIGASLPLTGPVADRSGPGYKGYELWVEQVNDAGTVCSAPGM